MAAKQLYIIKGEKDSKKSVRDELHNVLFDLMNSTGSLSTVAELMMDAGGKCDAVSIGSIVEHYAAIISDNIGKLEEFLTVIFNDTGSES